MSDEAQIGHNSGSNTPQTLAWEPLDSEHILACPRVPVRNVAHILTGKQKWFTQFAQNERVEKVQLSATLGGADSQVKLITVSGKEYVVPATVLQLVGFAS